MDYVKKRLAGVRGGGRVATGEGLRGIAGQMHEEARLMLEDSGVWGAKAAAAQKEMNGILHQRFTRNDDFYNAFYSGAGVPDPKEPWMEKLVADPHKIQSAMDRLLDPTRSQELQQFQKHIKESLQLADVMEKYYQPDVAGKASIAAMRENVAKATKSMDDALHYARRINQGKALSGVAHGGARGAMEHIAAFALGGPLGMAGLVAAKAMMHPGRIWHMQAIVERLMGSHRSRIAEGFERITGGVTRAASKALSNSTRVIGSTALLTQDIAKRQEAYGQTLNDLAAMASNRDLAIQALTAQHGPNLMHLPNSIPEMAGCIQRAAQFCLTVAPSHPAPGLFSDDELGLISDGEAEEFSNTVHAALDPVSILEFIERGQLTPQVLTAAETAAPLVVSDIRTHAMQLLTTAQGLKITPLHKVGIGVLMGIQSSPEYLAALQQSWGQSAQAPTARVSPGNMGDTGVNERYAKSTYSSADRLESGEHQP
jgi:hypothetical protein